jgi:hypothetical protein
MMPSKPTESPAVTSRRGTLLRLGALVAVACLIASPMLSAARATEPAAAASFPCTGPGSAKRPCRFGTPSGNIRCLWTPTPNNVACVLRSSGRAYRLRPYGRAKAIALRLSGHGQTLRRNEQLIFPQSLSCRATRTTMTCNQDFGSGAFTLAPRGSHRS